MARGYFRVDKTICVFCGDRAEGGHFWRGKKNNKIFLCEPCIKKYDEMEK